MIDQTERPTWDRLSAGRGRIARRSYRFQRPGWFRRRWLVGLLVVFVVLAVLGAVRGHKTIPPGPKAYTAGGQLVTPVKPAAPGFRWLVGAHQQNVACVDVLGQGTYLNGISALTVGATEKTRSVGYMWQFAATKATLTPGVPWALVFFWLNGTTVVGDGVAPAGGSVASPGAVTAAVALPVALDPYPLPSSLSLGGTCVPGA